MSFIRKPLALGLAAGIASIIQTPAGLAQGATALEEVVVTARKRTENLQDVPIAISAIDETTIQRAGVERAGDYISLIPNVTIVDTANVGDTQVSIRGVVSTRDAESTFAYVVDGVLSTNPNSFNEELFDVQQIEVLKGPQGALYGRNAVAGAVLVTVSCSSSSGVLGRSSVEVSGCCISGRSGEPPLSSMSRTDSAALAVSFASLNATHSVSSMKDRRAIAPISSVRCRSIVSAWLSVAV